MRIVRHCRERLPGGERLWRRLAKKAGFDGKVEVIGYGVGNTDEAAVHRKYAGNYKADITLAYIIYADNKIRVFVNSPCSKITDNGDPSPLFSFAHELGHFVHNRDDKTNTERTADMYARRVLKGI